MIMDSPPIKSSGIYERFLTEVLMTHELSVTAPRNPSLSAMARRNLRTVHQAVIDA
jgi:hypothetical protein